MGPGCIPAAPGRGPISSPFLGPSTGLDTAEQAAAKRLATDSFLGQSAGLDAAEAAALKRLNEGGARVDLEGDLAVSAEDVIRQRLMGVDNPLLEAQRERVRERVRDWKGIRALPPL